MRELGDTGPHITVCSYCGIVARGTFAFAEERMLGHRLLSTGRQTVTVVVADSFTPGKGEV